MNLLFRIVYAAHANGTHHKLALDALRHLESPDAARWQRLFLANSEVYLEGSKAPDTEFKDFKNHVLHVADNYWGGAPEKVESWYGRLVDALKAHSWHEAVYAAGIMSHYYTDPIHPFHTGQTAAENNIHRAVEWSISKSYGELAARNREKPLPEIRPAADAGWIKDHVIAGAETAHAHYATLIAHYNFERGVVDPPAGLDDVSKALVADLLAYAALGHARLLDRAFAQSGVTPPDVSLTAETFLATLKIPLKWLTRKIDDAADRRAVEAIYDELTATGTVEKTLPADDRQVRELHRQEVLEPREARRDQKRIDRRAQSPLPQGQIRVRGAAQPPAGAPERPAPKSTSLSDALALSLAATAPIDMPNTDRNTRPEAFAGAASEPLARLRDRARTAPPPPLPALPHSAEPRAGFRSSRDPDPYLAPGDDLEAAPSIGPKTAARFEMIGITTVEQFLAADPAGTAARLQTRHITASTIIDWQHQARLVCELPGLRGGHAQLLVGAGLISVAAIAESDPGEAMAAILRYAQTSAGQSALRDGTPPDLEKIHRWVEAARTAKAA